MERNTKEKGTWIGVEAYGHKGMKNTPWRKTFRTTEAMLDWAEKHDAEIEGSRDVEISR